MMSTMDKQRHSNINTLFRNREANTRSSTRGKQSFGCLWEAGLDRGQDGKENGEADCRKRVLLSNMLL